MMRRSWRANAGARIHAEHTKLEDPRTKGHRRVYASQALLASAALLVALVVKDVMTNAAVFAAIASTAFVLFVTPFSVVATPRHVIGGHAVSSGVGLAIAATGLGSGLAMIVLGLAQTPAVAVIGVALVRAQAEAGAPFDRSRGGRRRRHGLLRSGGLRNLFQARGRDGCVFGFDFGFHQTGC